LSQRILGIDPGLNKVGYGLIRVEGGKCVSMDFGFFPIPENTSLPRRLHAIYEKIGTLLETASPDAVAVEEAYVTQNAKTTLRLGHARGVILLAAEQRGVEVAEYSPREIKQAVSGKGGASKTQVQWMVAQILGLDTRNLQEDAADGLAVAICHSYRSSSRILSERS
jgi:crossover junction endodeoxyribonuclease RuvC